MKEIPILFSTPMVQAIMDGRKTITRRVITQHNSASTEKLANLNFEEVYLDGGNSYVKDNYLKVGHKTDGTCHRVFSRIAEGDILWVRETFGFNYFNEEIVFKAGPHSETYDPHLHGEDCKFLKDEKWRPSIFMPKDACRIWLQVTRVRAERLQDITEADAVAEGIDTKNISGDWEHTPVQEFETLWQKINGRESWEANPWVWVIEFKLLSTTGKPNF